MKQVFTAFILFIAILGVKSQDSIPFLVNTYEEALDKASADYKPILFYFHADYCYPCLDLDSMFRDDRLSRYLDVNYVNVRVDYNRPIGDRLSKKFNVKSLPSLVFLNEQQELLFVLEDDFDVDEILKFARWTTNPKSRGSNFMSALEKKQKIKNWEKVDSIFDFTVIDNYVVEKENETILYHQSKLHKTINDGLAEEHAAKYLKTQSDWKTDKNMQFIMDFVGDTRSDAFGFMVANKELFSAKYGQENVDQLIKKLVNRRLYQLQPPPNYQETKSLMVLLSPEKPDLRTYEYMMDLNLKMNKIVEYLYLERKYIKKFAPQDHERMINMIKIYLKEIPEDYNADYYMLLAETANKLNPNNIDYQITLARIYIKKGDKCGALENAVSAYTQTLKEGGDATEILELIQEIDKIHRKTKENFRIFRK